MPKDMIMKPPKCTTNSHLWQLKLSICLSRQRYVRSYICQYCGWVMNDDSGKKSYHKPKIVTKESE